MDDGLLPRWDWKMLCKINKVLFECVCKFFLSKMLCPVIMFYICSCLFHPGIPFIWFTQYFSRPVASIAYYIFCKISAYGVDRVCTMHFVEFIIFVQKLHNIFVKNYVFLLAFLHVSVFTHHLQDISYVC
jgi:hypothetical protein